MKSFIQGLIAVLIVATVGISLAPAGTIPQKFSTLPYVYDSVFPAAQLNTDFTYALSYTDSSVAVVTPMPYQVITASSIAVAGSYLAVNTAASAITVTLPTPSSNAATPLNAVTMLDATNTFNTHNLTVNASGIAPLNSLTGASAVFTNSTQGSVSVCQYLNSVIGYHCYTM